MLKIVADEAARNDLAVTLDDLVFKGAPSATATTLPSEWLPSGRDLSSPRTWSVEGPPSPDYSRVLGG